MYTMLNLFHRMVFVSGILEIMALIKHIIYIDSSYTEPIINFVVGEYHPLNQYPTLQEYFIFVGPTQYVD